MHTFRSDWQRVVHCAYAHAVVELAIENELLHLAPKQWCGALVCERDRFIDPPLSLLDDLFSVFVYFFEPKPLPTVEVVVHSGRYDISTVRITAREIS